ncbi:hypothetical protein GR11A_00176 [Vibrio phage vB_VcorM_GR11A]|nr:hypothetical protein GR11A_00176 [Vibrio phage vB_VcorM_GR11A]
MMNFFKNVGAMLAALFVVAWIWGKAIQDSTPQGYDVPQETPMIHDVHTKRKTRQFLELEGIRCSAINVLYSADIQGVSKVLCTEGTFYLHKDIYTNGLRATYAYPYKRN